MGADGSRRSRAMENVGVSSVQSHLPASLPASLLASLPGGDVGADSSRCSRASCPVCGRSMPLTRMGALRVHGPLSNRCEGSGMLPSTPLPVSLAPTLVTPNASLDSPGSDAALRGQSALRDPPAAFFTQLAVSNPVRILKRIPKASRHLASSKLARVLDSVAESNDDASWDRLLKFSSRCFAVPKRGGKRISLASQVNRQVQEETDLLSLRSVQPSRSVSSYMSNPLRSLSKRVSAKLEEGDYRGAVRAACSNDTIAVLSPDTISALQQKHPHAHPDSTILSQLSIGEDATLQCSEKEVARAIQSFPNGSASGPDGLRPQHLKDLIGAAAGNGGRDLLRALTAFVNFILQGHTQLSIRPSFFGTKLMPFRKKRGGFGLLRGSLEQFS